jgi:hypothetical protein
MHIYQWRRVKIVIPQPRSQIMRHNMLFLLTGIGAVFFLSFAAIAAEKYMPISAYSKSAGYNEYEISAAVIALSPEIRTTG